MVCIALNMFGLNMGVQQIWAKSDWAKSGNADQAYALASYASYSDITHLRSAALSMNPAPGVPPSFGPVAASCHLRASMAL